MTRASTSDIAITRRRHGGNPESVAAHPDLFQRQSQRNRVWLEVHQAGFRGLTVDELAEKWGAEVNRISGRFTELCRDGVIERQNDPEGKRITRRTRSGSQAAVWFITP